MVRFDCYRPSPAWFSHNPYGIHGIGHAGRVFVWANQIGRQMAPSTMSLEVVRWAAVLHDVGRISDGRDQGHGKRSAEWIKKNRNTLQMDMDDELLERVLYCCTMHDTADEEIGLLTEELKCLKDADGLDRVRINDLNPDFLRTEFARSFVDSAWDLFGVTRATADPWEAVRTAAGEKDSWRGSRR